MHKNFKKNNGFFKTVKKKFLGSTDYNDDDDDDDDDNDDDNDDGDKTEVGF